MKTHIKLLNLPCGKKTVTNDQREDDNLNLLESVKQQGSSAYLKDMGPFSFSDMLKIAEYSINKDVRVCIMEKQLPLIKVLSKEEILEQKKLYDELNTVNLKISKLSQKKGLHKKEMEKLNQRKLNIQNSLNQDSKDIRKKLYHFYVNVSQDDFIDFVQECFLNCENLNALYATIQENPEVGEMMQFLSDSDLTEEMFEQTGNYGIFPESQFLHQDYFEVSIPIKLYIALRKDRPQAIDHAAIKYEKLSYIRMLISDDLIDTYIQYFLGIEEESQKLRFRFIHQKEKYQLFDFDQMDSAFSAIREFRIPYSLDVAKTYMDKADKKDEFATFSIVINDGTNENIPYILLRTTLDFEKG